VSTDYRQLAIRIAGGDEHAAAVVYAAETIHANAPLNGGHPYNPDGPCLYCWLAAAYAVSSLLAAGYRKPEAAS
jgi:uncharacterized protein (DUF2236 family)